MNGFTLENLVDLYFTLAKVNGTDWAITVIFNSFVKSVWPISVPVELIALRVWVGDFIYATDDFQLNQSLETLEKQGFFKA
jgi:hypothetical protein